MHWQEELAVCFCSFTLLEQTKKKIARVACVVVEGPLGHHQRINFEASQVQPQNQRGWQGSPNEDQYLASELMFGAVHRAEQIVELLAT